MSATELIEKYNDGELLGIDLENFKNRLNSDPDFAREFKLYQDIDKALLEKDILVFRKQLQNAKKVADEEKKEKVIVPFYRKRITYWAAAVIITVFAMGYVISGIIDNSYSGEKLYSMYYNPDDAVLIERSGDSNADKVLIEAMQIYDKGMYADAVDLFKLAGDNNTARFYLGISYMEIDELDLANEALQIVIQHNNKDNLFVEQAEWYLALCALKSENMEKAISQFSSIANGDSFYNNKAKEILSYIEK